MRLALTAAGAAACLLVVALGLRQLGRCLGGTEPELYGRAARLGVIVYAAALAAALAGGLANPYGPTGLPFVAGTLAAVGGCSPLLWMMQWFRAGLFVKAAGPPLTVPPSWAWRAAGLAATAGYALVLGPGFTF